MFAIGSRFSQRYAPPIDRWESVLHLHGSALCDAQLDEEEDKERTEEEIGHLQKITGLDVFCMIAQERFPGLSMGASWANLLDILLEGPFTDLNL